MCIVCIYQQRISLERSGLEQELRGGNLSCAFQAGPGGEKKADQVAPISSKSGPLAKWRRMTHPPQLPRARLLSSKSFTVQDQCTYSIISHCLYLFNFIRLDKLLEHRGKIINLPLISVSLIPLYLQLSTLQALEGHKAKNLGSCEITDHNHFSSMIQYLTDITH